VDRRLAEAPSQEAQEAQEAQEEEDLQELMSMLEGLSEEEVEAELARRGAEETT
jgi:hypothetical protein